MASEQLTDTTEQSEPQAIDPVDVKSGDRSTEMLDQLRKRLPLFMTEKKKLLLIDKMTMHGAGVCRARGDTDVSIDDILVGAYQAVGPH